MKSLSKNELDDSGYGSAWKYFISADNAINAMHIYSLLVKDCVEKKQSRFIGIISGNIELPENECSMIPGDTVSLFGEKIQLSFLANMYINAFFQECRNFFDYVAQIIVEIFSNEKPHVGSVDFFKISQMTFANISVKEFIDEIKNSNKYKYICDFNNTTKHNYNIGIISKITTKDLTLGCNIPPFKKEFKNKQHNSYVAVDIENKMDEIFKFTNKAFTQMVDFVHNHISLISSN